VNAVAGNDALKPKDEKPHVIEIEFEGKVHRIDMLSVSGRQAREFRREVGVPFMGAFNRENMDLDVIAGFLWLARRKDEPDLSFDDLLDSVTFDSFKIEEVAETPNEVPDPEA
jgi:hypothetical protein